MAVFFPVPLGLRPARAFLPILLALAFAGCERPERAELAQLKPELVAARAQFAQAEKALAATRDELTLTTATLEATKKGLIENERTITALHAQLRTTQADLDALKKRDAFVFAELRTHQQQGRNIIALAGYQKFLKDFPASPFAADATDAITALSAQAQQESQRWAELADPKRKERELLGLFRDGLLTPRELAPLIKRKTRTQVLDLLGKPTHVFPDGKEIGYNDRITNPATGRRSMLVITFDAGIVAALRADYAGQKLIP